jgi:hypothetical protein
MGIAKKLGAFSRVYTLFFVILGWVLFRVESLPMAAQYAGAMFGVGSEGLIDETFWYYFSNGKWILLAGIVLSTPIIPFCKERIAASRVPTLVYQAVAAIVLGALFCLSLLVCIKSSYNPFIYFNF